MYDEKSKELLSATLAADSHALGAHWVYDMDELQNLEMDWNVLNAPHVAWHEGKGRGDFTHYGDQIIILDDYLKENNIFDIKTYMNHWQEAMKIFKGYKDGAINETLANLKQQLPLPCGSTSHDMSIVGRIVPLLRISKTKEDFLNHTKLFAQVTHNDEMVLESMHFFSTLLLEVLEGKSIKKSIVVLKDNYSPAIQEYIQAGIDSKELDTREAIATFGPACPTDSAFPSTIHILFKYDDFKEALIQNAKAGGDSAARAMVIAYLMTAQQSIEIVPKAWLEFNA